MTTHGVLISLVSFAGPNGAFPNQLVAGTDGNFYGTTMHGGSSGYGTAFKVTTNGMLTSLASFTLIGESGGYPSARLVLGRDGNFYGTTTYGGRGYKNVFRVTTEGVLTSIVSFTGDNGSSPYAGLGVGK